MSDGQNGNAVSDVRLPLPPGMTASQPSRSPQSQVSIINGQMSQRVGRHADLDGDDQQGRLVQGGSAERHVRWRARAGQSDPDRSRARLGRHGWRAAARAARLRSVQFLRSVRAGQFALSSGFQLQEPVRRRAERGAATPEEPTYPEELRVDKAPDPIAFLRATVTPNPVVVGQQVTLRVFAYGGRGQFSAENPNEPSHADFLTFDTGPDQVESLFGAGFRDSFHRGQVARAADVPAARRHAARGQHEDGLRRPRLSRGSRTAARWSARATG